MVSAFDSGARGPGLCPGQGHWFLFLGRILNSTVPLSIQVPKWVFANLILGGNPAMD